MDKLNLLVDYEPKENMVDLLLVRYDEDSFNKESKKPSKKVDRKKTKSVIRDYANWWKRGY